MKLIDVINDTNYDEFINEIYDCCDSLGATDNIAANCLIDNLLAIEVNTVRCMKCKYLWRNYDGSFCKHPAGLRELYADSFCKYGEKK